MLVGENERPALSFQGGALRCYTFENQKSYAVIVGQQRVYSD
tara:strand:- start:149 stop:274 length:126 start_codon:yes stop_codon:yes gene_type:complete